MINKLPTSNKRINAFQDYNVSYHSLGNAYRQKKKSISKRHQRVHNTQTITNHSFPKQMLSKFYHPSIVKSHQYHGLHLELQINISKFI